LDAVLDVGMFELNAVGATVEMAVATWNGMTLLPYH
jgi:hypothetical protein